MNPMTTLFEPTRPNLANAMEGMLMMPAAKTIGLLEAKTKKDAATKHAKPKVLSFKGECSYCAFRRFLFRSVYPHAPARIRDNVSLLIERDKNPRGGGHIHIEADGIQVERHIPQMEGTRVVRVGQLLGIIYNSSCGRSTVFWRKPGTVRGQAAPRTVKMLSECIRAASPPLPDLQVF